MKIEVEVISDVICPWCFIGKRRLKKSHRIRWSGQHDQRLLVALSVESRHAATGN